MVYKHTQWFDAPKLHYYGLQALPDDSTHLNYSIMVYKHTRWFDAPKLHYYGLQSHPVIRRT